MPSAVPRVWHGHLPDGRFDFRISTPGNNAETADVNDPKKISFSALRDNERVREVGTIATSDTWVDFKNTYTDLPFCIVFNLRSNLILHAPLGDRGTIIPGYAGTNRWGMLYVPVIDPNFTRIMVTKPVTAGGNYGTLPDDSFIYFVLGI